MLTFLSFLTLAQIALPTPPPPPTVPPPSLPTRTAPRQVVEYQDVRPLPGGLDGIPVFNSNSPELIQSDGILLSTFPSGNMRVPSAHLNFPLSGRFDIFAHHIARGMDADDNRTLYFGILAYNPTRRPIEITSLQGATYLGQDAPFLDLPSYVANPLGTVFSGPGSRTMNDVLRGQRHSYLPASVTIPSRRSVMLLNVPIPLRRLTVPTDGTWIGGRVIPVPMPPPPPEEETEGNGDTDGGDEAADKAPQMPRPLPMPDNRPIPSNGRSALMHLNSSDRVYLASMAMYAPRTPDGNERVPTLYEWQQLLQNGGLAGPRDHPPTPPDAASFSRFFYGRVAGVAQGSEWVAQLTDTPDGERLTIPEAGEQFSYVMSSVDRNTFGTGQIQSAPMLVRYPDTAYRAHGNYGIKYDLSLPLYNPTNQLQTVNILFQTPLQNERLEGLSFLSPPADRTFFRGTLRLRYSDDWNIPQTRYFHLIQKQGQKGDPLIRLRMMPGDRRLVRLEFIYPPDSTPPQVLTVQTNERGDR